jgi:hypothetical protein
MSGGDIDDDTFNEKMLWRDVAKDLSGAQNLLEQAQGKLEDLHRSDYADQLQPIVDAVRQASNEATEEGRY